MQAGLWRWLWSGLTFWPGSVRFGPFGLPGAFKAAQWFTGFVHACACTSGAQWNTTSCMWEPAAAAKKSHSFRLVASRCGLSVKHTFAHTAVLTQASSHRSICTHNRIAPLLEGPLQSAQFWETTLCIRRLKPRNQGAVIFLCLYLTTSCRRPNNCYLKVSTLKGGWSCLLDWKLLHVKK